MYGNNHARDVASKLAEMPQQAQGAMAGSAGRQSTKAMLLEGADRLRKEAMQLEALAFAVDHITGEADQMLYRLLSAHVYR